MLLNKTQGVINAADIKKYDQLESQFKEQHGLEKISLNQLYEILIQQETEYSRKLEELEVDFTQAVELLDARIEEVEVETQDKINREVWKKTTPISQTQKPGILYFKLQLEELETQFSALTTELQQTSMTFQETVNSHIENELPVWYLRIEYENLVLKKNEILAARNNRMVELADSEFNWQPPLQLKVDRIKEQIKLTQKAMEELKPLQEKFKSLLANPAIEQAKEKRNNAIGTSRYRVNLEIKNLDLYVKSIDAKYSQYVKIDQAELEAITAEAQVVVDEFERQSIQNMQRNEALMINKVEIFRNSIAAQIEKADAYLKKRADWLSDLKELKTRRNLYLTSILDLDSLLIEAEIESRGKTYLEGLPKTIVQHQQKITDDILKLTEETKQTEQEIIKRTDSIEIQALNRLIATIESEKNKFLKGTTPFEILDTLSKEMKQHEQAYIHLALKFDRFHQKVLATLSEHVSADSLKRLTNEAPDATVVGNFIRSFLEIIHTAEDVLRSFIGVQQRANRTQFFASTTETTVAQTTNACLKILDEVKLDQEQVGLLCTI